MARPKLADRDSIKTVRVTILVPIAVSDEIHEVARSMFGGNTSALLREAFDKFTHGGKDGGITNNGASRTN